MQRIKFAENGNGKKFEFIHEMPIFKFYLKMHYSANGTWNVRWLFALCTKYSMTVSVLYVSTSRGEGEKNVLDGYRERV